jgi:hypothetical protein
MQARNVNRHCLWQYNTGLPARSMGLLLRLVSHTQRLLSCHESGPLAETHLHLGPSSKRFRQIGGGDLTTVVGRGLRVLPQVDMTERTWESIRHRAGIL